jgi:hypothetical protein
MKNLTRQIPFLLTLLALNSIASATAENLPGQKVEDNTGSVFMEEVLDSEKVKQEEQRLKKKSTLERARPTDEQLQNVGVQVTPSGSIIPLINRGAPPVKQMGTQMTSSFEPLYPGYVVLPGRPYPGAPIGAPGTGVAPLGGVVPIPYGPGYVLNSPGYSYTWDSTPGAPATPPSSVTTSGSIQTGPFVGGYAGRDWNGRMQGGAVIGVPTNTQFQSTTTFTPIPPSAPTNTQQP